MSVDLSNYVDVAERIRIFKNLYPTGSLQPVDPAKPYTIETIGERIFIVYASAAYRTPDDPRPGIGLAWEPFPGRTPYTKDSELMVCETSSWGRAIVAVLAADSQRIASQEEVRNRLDDDPKPVVKKATSKKPSFEPDLGKESPAPSKGAVQYIRRTAEAVAKTIEVSPTALMNGLFGCDPEDLNEEAAKVAVQELTRAKKDPTLVEVDPDTGKVTIHG